MRDGAGRALAPRCAIDPASLDEVARILAAAQRGLIACGPSPRGPSAADLDAYRRDIASLAIATGFPVLAEATSQARFGIAHDRGPVLLSLFDALLRSPAFRGRFTPDAILELGAPPTSAGYAQLLAERPDIPRIVVAPHGWSDPTSTASVIVRASVPAFCRALVQRIGGATNEARSAWSRALASEDDAARGVLETALTEAETLTEGAVARAVAHACPAGSTLVLGNSSPVRDADTWTLVSSKPLHVLHQRGASGIDGLVSGAAGAQTVSQAPVSLLLGDLSLLHDIGGLAVAREARGPLVIVVVNNAGGRIFEQLPIGRALGPGPAFERCFATPQPIDFAAAAAAFGIAFERARAAPALAAALAAAHERSSATLIEAVVPPHDGAARLKTVWTRVDARYQPRKDTQS
jgi:2-succinyl-5-enolpyruvyl-6-hydroxy-3-cyclohexene-1-carboxylate synthase